MQKFLSVVIVILLLVVAVAVVYTQARLYTTAYHPQVQGKTDAGVSVPSVHTAQKPAIIAMPSVPVIPPVQSAPVMTLGTPSSPIVVKLADIPASPEESAEREKDRDIQRGIEHYTERLAATSLANNYLLLFQAIIYFLTLIILYLLMENVKKFADAAGRSAEAARKSAETAELLLKKSEKNTFRPYPLRNHPRR